jgi:hypothetical protein
MEELQTIDDIVKYLLEIRSKYGNLQVADIIWETADRQMNELIAIKPCVVTNPITKKDYLVIFD